MSALETSIESLTAEHTALTQKLERIDQQYKVDRPAVVKELNQLARALSALTGKPVAGAGNTVRKPMSEEGKAAIRAGLEKARQAKKAATGAQTQQASLGAAATAKPNPVPIPSPDARKEAGEKPGPRR